MKMGGKCKVGFHKPVSISIGSFTTTDRAKAVFLLSLLFRAFPVSY